MTLAFRNSKSNGVKGPCHKTRMTEVKAAMIAHRRKQSLFEVRDEMNFKF